MASGFIKSSSAGDLEWLCNAVYQPSHWLCRLSAIVPVQT